MNPSVNPSAVPPAPPLPPSGSAIFHACSAAALAFAAEIAVMAIYSGGIEAAAGVPLLFPILLFAFILAALHLMLLGLPLYLLLSRFYRPGLTSSAICGFLIGALPLGLWIGGGDPAGLLAWGLPGLAAGLAFGITMDRERRRAAAPQQEEIFA
jgi:hypothetical protein